jgi:4-aminobutyrate aminotransferase-like enzyme
MTINYDAMSLDELRRYVLTHREDLEAFHNYIDRSKAQGRMISIDLNSDRWEEDLTARIQQITSTEGESN